MFACLTLGVVFTVFWAAVHLPVFNLVGITVEGEVDHNNANTLRANVTTRMTGNFFTADLRQVRDAFEGVPWVRLATVQREFPNRLRVTLQEHRPVAYWGEQSESRLLVSAIHSVHPNTLRVDAPAMSRVSGLEIRAAPSLNEPMERLQMHHVLDADLR